RACSSFWIAFETLRRRGPFGEGEPVDLGVVADVDREARMKIEEFDRLRVLVLEGERAEFVSQTAAGTRIRQIEFNNDGRTLLAAGAEADEGTARGETMRAKHPFARFGVQGASGGLDAFGLAPAEPEAAIGVEVTTVTHAVPDAAGSGVG